MKRRIIAAALLVCPPAAARAEDEPRAPFGAEITARLQGEYTAPNGGKPRVTVFTDAELAFWADHGSWLSLDGDIKLERGRNANLNSYFPARNALLRSEAATLRQLYVTLRPLEGLALYGGKIHPAFGTAYKDMPGLFYSFATDYEQDERIGFGIAYQIPERFGLGPLRASFEVFYLDTSVLSGSLPRGPSLQDATADRAWRYTRGQFGPSNTGSLASWTAALKGGPAGEGVSWQVSFTHEATVEPGGRAEDGQSVSASYAPTENGIALTDTLAVTPFAEYAHFTNFQTVAGLERHYLLGGLAFKAGKWELDATAGQRISRGSATGTDHQENVSLTYEILEGFRLGAGLNHVTLGGRGSWTLAPALSYARKF